MSYEVIVPKPVQKQIDKLPESIRDLLTEKIIAFSEQPRPFGIKKLKGFDHEYRLRVGDYRVRYEIDDKALIVLILYCKHRKDIYRS
jgi:mRNA interferase RelE/StbE